MPSRAGSPNKNKNAALALLKRKLGADFHPLLEMAELYQETPKEDVNLRFTIMKEVSPYCLPKLKAVEVQGDTTQHIVVTWENGTN